MLIEKISDLYQEYLMAGEKMDGAVRFIKQVKLIAPPKVKKPAVSIKSFVIYNLKSKFS